MSNRARESTGAQQAGRDLRDIVATEDVPWHYLTEREVLFSRKDLD